MSKAVGQKLQPIEWPGEEFLCGCNTESLRVMSNEYGEIEFAIWKYGHGRPGWRAKLHWIWRILTRGTPYGDQVSLDESATDRLVQVLMGIQKTTTTSRHPEVKWNA